MLRMNALRRLFTLLVLISAVFGSLGLGAEFAEAIPALAGDICTDDCADGEAASCDGICICACCPPPAVPPAFSLNLGPDIVVGLVSPPVSVRTSPPISAPYHPPQ